VYRDSIAMCLIRGAATPWPASALSLARIDCVFASSHTPYRAYRLEYQHQSGDTTFFMYRAQYPNVSASFGEHPGQVGYHIFDVSGFVSHCIGDNWWVSWTGRIPNLLGISHSYHTVSGRTLGRPDTIAAMRGV
jgi:hypothetical protein